MIVLLSETLRRLDAHIRLLFFRADERMFLNRGSRLAITVRRQANKSLCLVSSMIILLQLRYVYSLCYNINMEDTFSGLMPCHQYFRCIKVTNHDIVLPV